MAQHSSLPPAQYPYSAQKPSRFRSYCKPSMLLALASFSAILLSGCSDVHVPGFIAAHTPPGGGGIVVADEPQAALVGRDVLARGGNAADAATATAFALGVTLPSRASLGGGGACLISEPGQAEAKAITFLAPAGQGEGERPASVPLMARGLYLLQLRYGSVHFEDVIDPAIHLARQGISVSKALAADLDAVKGPLLDDRGALSVFGKEGNLIVGVGDQLVQTRLSSFLSRLKLAGVGDLYSGALSEVFVNQAQQSGAALTRDDLRKALPGESAALVVEQGNYRASFLPPPADGGLGSAMAFKHGTSAEGAVQAWRQSGLAGTKAAQTFLNKSQSSAQPLPSLPASTSFIVKDHYGLAVACTLSDNNLFGTGRIAGSTGVILGASPQNYPKPLLSAAIIQSKGKQPVNAVLSASGQNAAAQIVADALTKIMHDQPLSTVTSGSNEGRLNAIICKKGQCSGTADPRGSGLSTSTKAPS
ncbi:gamma-glutamyltransferase [Aristophania vespae]|uniref:gamma-glutamyltransferase n=1 Tax=Aristophania vespae TaxID=2697033 RepID=UPI002351084E|nr:gamma-glutamyltransferase [Aristophania vespae]UMM63896.1 hypothetical protein DM15PD_08750 [Aristophania vespae]